MNSTSCSHIRSKYNKVCNWGISRPSHWFTIRVRTLPRIPVCRFSVLVLFLAHYQLLVTNRIRATIRRLFAGADQSTAGCWSKGSAFTKRYVLRTLQLQCCTPWYTLALILIAHPPTDIHDDTLGVVSRFVVHIVISHYLHMSSCIILFCINNMKYSAFYYT